MGTAGRRSNTTSASSRFSSKLSISGRESGAVDAGIITPPGVIGNKTGGVKKVNIIKMNSLNPAVSRLKYGSSGGSRK